MSHANTYPYIGVLDGDCHPKLYLSHGCYNFTSDVDKNSAWYDCYIYLIDNGYADSTVISDNKYDITYINLKGLSLYTGDGIIPYIKLCSTQQIKFNMNSDTYYVIADCSVLSNQGSDSDVTVFELYGNDVLALIFNGTVNINVYHQYITCSSLDNTVLQNTSNVYINYYYNEYDFSQGSHYLEYLNGIILKSPCSDGNYTFDNTGQSLTIYVNDDIETKISNSTFGYDLTLINNGCHYLTMEACQFNITDDEQVKLLGTGKYKFTCSCLFNIRNNICAPVKMCGTCSLYYYSISYDTCGGYTYEFVIKSDTTGGSTIKFDENTFSPQQVAVYWCTLDQIDSNTPFQSGCHKYFATNYKPSDTFDLVHNQCGYKYNGNVVTTKTIVVASGIENNDAVTLVGTINASSYSNFDGNDYSGKLTTLFSDSNIYSNEYYGALDGSQTQNDTVASDNTKATFTIDFSTDYSIYLGNANLNLSYVPDDSSYGTPPQFNYSITDNNNAPTLTTTTTDITINNRCNVVRQIHMSLDHGFGLPLYLFPYLGNDMSILDAASLFEYAEQDNGCTYLSYSDYLSADQCHIQYVNPGSTCIIMKIKYDFSLHVAYLGGDNFRVDLETLADHSVNYTFESNDISTENQLDFSYPIVSSSDEPDDLSHHGSDNVYDISDYGATGTFNITEVSYSKVYYIGMLSNTQNGNAHTLLITGLGDQISDGGSFTYAYSSYGTYDSGVSLTDNEDGTATLVIPATNYNLYGVTIEVTTSNSLNTYYFGDGNEQFYFNVIDQTNLLGPLYTSITPSYTYIETDFIFPTAIGISLDGDTYYTSGSRDFSFNKGDAFTFYVQTAGKVRDSTELICAFDISRSDNSEIISCSDDGSDISSFNVRVCSGNTTGEKVLYSIENNLISGPAYFTITLNNITDSNSVTYSPILTVDNIILTDNSRNHVVSFESGLGTESNTQTYSQNSNDVQQPSSFTSGTPTSLGAKTADLAANIYVQFNSIPYDITTQEYYTVVVHYLAQGKVNTGDSWTNLSSDGDYTIYTNTNFDTTTDELVTVNSDNYSSGSNTKYFVLSDSSPYKYIQLLYYATNTCNHRISSNCDYYNLPTCGSPSVIATYDYSVAESGTLSCRILSLGNWQFRSDPAGNLLISYLGSTTSENFTTREYKIMAVTQNDTNNTPSYIWNGNA